LSARFGSTIRSAEAARFFPLIGALIGVLGGSIYWLGAQIWPSNVAVILAMTGTTLLTTEFSSTSPATRIDLLSRMFLLLIKYNALMSLSAAKLPFVVPPNLALGLIMICGHAASFALAVSAMAIRPEKAAARIPNGSLSVALLIGFAPAALLGVPGLIGLAAAIFAGLCAVAYRNFKRAAGSGGVLDRIQMLTEACFYLGALAAWGYV